MNRFGSHLNGLETHDPSSKTSKTLFTCFCDRFRPKSNRFKALLHRFKVWTFQFGSYDFEARTKFVLSNSKYELLRMGSRHHPLNLNSRWQLFFKQERMMQ